jgi:hypothetical protein
MNNKLNIEVFNSLKSDSNCLDLDINIISSINDSFSNNDFKNKKYKTQQKKVQNVLKNPKIKLIKDKICNKVNLILNKLSENNIDNLITEFIENIKIYNLEDYNEFLKTLYFKILSEINFIKIYLSFFTLITKIYNSNYNFTTEYFYNLIENKFNLDYCFEYNSDYLFLNDIDDDLKRLNNLTLINEMINLKFFNDKFRENIENIILTQNKYLSDIHHWFKNTKLSNDQSLIIKSIINNEIQLRDKVLLENLLNGNTSKIIFKSIEKVNNPISQSNLVSQSNSVELDNILDEYIFINNSESLENYIQTNCIDANNKNKFCEYLINKYFKLSNDEYKKIINLFKFLIKNKILFKSNLSRGLLNIYPIKNINLDRLKNLLLFLKNQGITKGLESLLIKYSILDTNKF